MTGSTRALPFTMEEYTSRLGAVRGEIRRRALAGLVVVSPPTSTGSPATAPPPTSPSRFTATTMYREMGMGFWLEQAEAESRALA